MGLAAYNNLLDERAQERMSELEDETEGNIRITVQAPARAPFFWEMLYVDAERPFELDPDPDSFWGFRHPIGRAYWDLDAPPIIRLQSGLFSAIHGELEYSKSEVRHLAKQVEQACQRWGLGLRMRLLDQEIPAEILSAQRLIELFHSDEFRYGMVHFACHCDNPEDAGASRAYLSLTSGATELDLYLEKLVAARRYHFLHKPLVFLNACGSATPGHLLQTLSFPSEMIRFGAGGVIATACTMPDNFASAFGAEFVRRLLRLTERQLPYADGSDGAWSADIGEVLMQTRRHFLDQHNNPLGLAYGLYAVSEQELELD